MPQRTIVLMTEGETWESLASRLSGIEGPLLVILPSADELLPGGSSKWGAFLTECTRLKDRLEVATRHEKLREALAMRGVQTIHRTRVLRALLKDDPLRDEAMRLFSPHLWQQQMKSHLQALGILSLPKLRVWVLIGVSALLFLFVILRLLPSAEVRVSPRQDTMVQTINIFLVQSGAAVDISDRVHKLELRPLRVVVDKTITFDQISKKFIGKSARMPIKITNAATEDFSLRGGSRIVNQAGMVFKIDRSVYIEPGASVSAEAVADDLDLYGEIIGERGNVPAGLKWEFPGLPEEERKLIEVINVEEGRGGTSSYTTVLKPQDLEIAKTKLEQELLSVAKQLINEEREIYNEERAHARLEVLYYEELTKTEFSNFVMPTQFLEQEVKSVPVSGSVAFTMYAYDNQAVMDLLQHELEEHVGEGKRLLPDSMGFERLIAHVIEYDDFFSWIKITVDLSGTQEYILDPLSPSGARFGKKVRDSIGGLHLEDALRIVKNLPEVEHAEVSVWPPWSRTLPAIPAHISIVPYEP